MLYTLDDKVIYDPVNANLRRHDEKVVDATHLTVIANKILHHLVMHHGELVTRETLFDEVWEKAGIASSSNTLNQYISLLRKTLAGYLERQDIIVTVPRAGYYLSKEISISVHTHQHQRFSHLPKYIAAAMALGVIVAGSFLYTTQPEKIIPRKIGEIKGCPVYDISGVKSDVADASSFAVAKEALEKNNQICTQTTAFYMFAQEALHLHKPARVMFSRCIEWDDSRDTCQNIYYYDWIR
ncbi:winged helix-turn-helix domain-containing protein [Enterobacter roggenkampii]|uniref:winged helix-turn-helix domain-containing protein n=1 Tax=Enterobacter roggenkampii TaxID=1812935 RepID=UPI002DBEB0CF|nr:winged helix-turn-helix domain-containing protein [Enterobacter roggenkampii]MEB6185370.1 winged helix-turn-helix domain-containing protein [Enterobacter roggenkampii]